MDLFLVERLASTQPMRAHTYTKMLIYLIKIQTINTRRPDRFLFLPAKRTQMRMNPNCRENDNDVYGMRYTRTVV